MSADRCPSCDAAIKADASWCNLCYADLRPAPAPTPEEPPAAVENPPAPTAAEHPHRPTAVPAQRPVDVLTAGTLDPLAAPIALVEQPHDVRTETRGWPCHGCEQVVPFEQDECPACGTRFLAGAALPDPLTARLGAEHRGESWKMIVILGGTVAIVVFLVLAMTIIGVVL